MGSNPLRAVLLMFGSHQRCMSIALELEYKPEKNSCQSNAQSNPRKPIIDGNLSQINVNRIVWRTERIESDTFWFIVSHGLFVLIQRQIKMQARTIWGHKCQVARCICTNRMVHSYPHEEHHCYLLSLASITIAVFLSENPSKNSKIYREWVQILVNCQCLMLYVTFLFRYWVMSTEVSMDPYT